MDPSTTAKINQEAGEASRLYVQQYALTILDMEDGLRPASGTLVLLGERLFVATAAHVIPGNPNGRLWLVTRQGTHDREGFPSFVSYGTSSDPALDVGFLELNPKVARQYFGARSYCPIGEIGILEAGRKNRGCLVVGSPGEKIAKRPIGSNKLLIGAEIMPFWSVPRALTEWPTPPADSTPANPEVDIFFDYPSDEELAREGYSPINLPDPGGMSGGAMWDQGFETGAVWVPSHCKLFGIQASWDPTQRYIRGVQIIHWLRLMHQHYSDLRPLLEHQFPELK